MTHVSCPSCRLRFTRGLAAHLTECPLCGSLLDQRVGAELMLGHWLFDADSSDPQGAAHGSPIVATPTALAPRRPAQAISIAREP